MHSQRHQKRIQVLFAALYLALCGVFAREGCQPGDVICFCQGQPPELFSVPGDNRHFYDCGLIELRECPNKQVYDPIRRKCVTMDDMLQLDDSPYHLASPVGAARSPALFAAPGSTPPSHLIDGTASSAGRILRDTPKGRGRNLQATPPASDGYDYYSYSPYFYYDESPSATPISPTMGSSPKPPTTNSPPPSTYSPPVSYSPSPSPTSPPTNGGGSTGGGSSGSCCANNCWPTWGFYWYSWWWYNPCCVSTCNWNPCASSCTSCNGGTTNSPAPPNNNYYSPPSNYYTPPSSYSPPINSYSPPQYPPGSSSFSPPFRAPFSPSPGSPTVFSLGLFSPSPGSPGILSPSLAGSPSPGSPGVFSPSPLFASPSPGA